MTQLAKGPVWGSFSDIHPVREDFFEWKRHRPSARTDMRVTDASDELSLLTRVRVGGTFRRIRGGPGAVYSGPDTHVLTWREGDLLVAVEAQGVDRATVDVFIRSLRRYRSARPGSSKTPSSPAHPRSSSRQARSSRRPAVPERCAGP